MRSGDVQLTIIAVAVRVETLYKLTGIGHVARQLDGVAHFESERTRFRQKRRFGRGSAGSAARCGQLMIGGASSIVVVGSIVIGDRGGSGDGRAGCDVHCVKPGENEKVNN